MSQIDIEAFCKFGKPEHIAAFVRGQLYLNPLSYFTRLEGDAARGDTREGDRWWLDSRRHALEIQMKDGSYVPLANVVSPFRFRNPEDQLVNLFCLCAVRDGRSLEQLDARNHAFGEAWAFITHPAEFLERIRVACQREKLACRAGLVTYVDEATYTGAMGYFRKSMSYSYQEEFRFVVKPGLETACILEIGTLEDISVVGSVRDLRFRDEAEPPFSR